MPISDRPRYEVTEEIAELLRTEKARQRVSVTELAEQLGVSRASVSDVLNAKVSSTAVLLDMCDLLGIERYRAMPLEETQRRWLAILDKFTEARGTQTVSLRNLIDDTELRANAELDNKRNDDRGSLLHLNRPRRRPRRRRAVTS